MEGKTTVRRWSRSVEAFGVRICPAVDLKLRSGIKVLGVEKAHNG